MTKKENKKNPLNYEEPVDRVRVLDRAIEVTVNEYGKFYEYAEEKRGKFKLELVEKAYRQLCSLLSE